MSNRCHEFGCNLAAAQTESGQLPFCEQHARERGYQLLRCPICSFMDWMRGNQEEACGICFIEGGQDVQLEVVSGPLPEVRSPRATQKPYLGWKYARSKKEFVEGEVLLVATLSKHAPAGGSTARTWQVDSVLVCYKNNGEDLALRQHDGIACDFDWNDVVWYSTLEDLQQSLHSLPDTRS